jgi:iron complex outermembrane receptor protein
VVDSRLIEGAGATTFSELATLIPSVVFSQQQSPVQANVGIRGVTTAGGSAALEPSVGIYVDGVFTDRTAFGIGDFNDIERVEVLRGPQSTLFGNSSPAGVINFVTRAPSATFGAELSATVGDFNRQQLAATVTGPLLGETLLGRLSLFSHTRDGYLNNVVGVDSNDQNSQGMRGKLEWRPSNSVTATFGLEWGRVRQNCCVPLFDPVPQALTDRFATASATFPFRGTGAPFPANQIDSQTIAVDGRNTYEQDLWAATLQLVWQIGDLELTSLSSYREIDQFSIADIDFTVMDLILFPGVTRRNEQQSQEFRIASPADQAFSWLAGAYYFRKIVSEVSASLINPQVAALGGGGIVAQNLPSGSRIDNLNLAVFAEGTLELSERWSVTGGLRWNHDDKSIFAFAARLRANGTPLSPTQFIPEAFRNRDGGQLSGRLLIQGEISPTVNTYLAYSRGYKAFGINDDANLLRNVPGASFFFDSEIVDNYEAGFRIRVPDARITASLVLFSTNYKDFQSLSSFTDTNNQLRFFLQNAASLTSAGVEVDITARPTDRLTLNFSMTGLDARFDSFPNAEGPSGPISLTGQPLRDAPRFSSSLVARYVHPVGDTLEVFTQGDWFYRTKVYTDQNLDPLLVQPAYSKYNLRVGFGRRDGAWSVEAWGRNLTDEITFGRGGQPVFGAVTNLLPLAGSPSFPTAGSRVKFTGEPRSYGLTVRSRF